MEQTTEVRSEDGKLIGYVLSFKGPAFVGGAKCFTPLDTNREPIALAQPSMQAAVALLRK